jgi:hypothetical protein
VLGGETPSFSAPFAAPERQELTRLQEHLEDSLITGAGCRIKS